MGGEQVGVLLPSALVPQSVSARCSVTGGLLSLGVRPDSVEDAKSPGLKTFAFAAQNHRSRLAGFPLPSHWFCRAAPWMAQHTPGASPFKAAKRKAMFSVSSSLSPALPLLK